MTLPAEGAADRAARIHGDGAIHHAPAPEGASLDTVPEVAYSQKPSCDGRANKTIAQRGIMGFEPRSARKGYIYNPDRNPSLAMPANLPVDRETCAALWDKEADLRNGALEKEYYTALKAYLAALNTASPAASAGKRKKYMCTHCGVPQEGPRLPQSDSAKEAERLVGSGGCEADAQMSYLSSLAVLPVGQRALWAHP